MRLIIIIFFILFLNLDHLPFEAQALIEETLTVNGIDHTIRYAPDEPAEKIQVVRDVLRRVMTVYSDVTRIIDVDIDLSVVTSPPVDGILADAGPASGGTATCNVRLFRTRANRISAGLRFTVAHELAHCFQYRMRLNPETILRARNSDHDDNGWWVEGSAEWMASLVFPPAGAPINQIIPNFYTISSQTILQDHVRGHYEQFWFFKALEQQRGRSGVIDFIMHVPTTRAEQRTFLDGPSQTIFVNYGRALVRHRIQYQPPLNTADRVISTYPVRTFPGELLFRVPELSAELVKISFPAPRARQGITLRVKSGSEAGYHVIGPDGQEITTEGRRYCGDGLQNPMRLVITRGLSSADASVTVEVKEVGCSDAVCYAGEWIAWVGSGAPVDSRYLSPDYTTGKVRFTISENGEITGLVTGSQSLPNRTWITVDDAMMHGDFTLTSELVDDGHGQLTASIRFTQPLIGSGIGRGGRIYIQDGLEITEFLTSVSATLRIQSFSRLVCGNVTESADGKHYGYLALFNGEYPGDRWLPFMEMGRP